MKNNKKWVLCVGSSFSAIPIFYILKKYGFNVAVCGNQKNDPCHLHADKSFYIDYSNKKELLELVERESFEYIVPTCNDYSYIAAAYVAERKGYPGFDKTKIVSLLHTKNKFRQYTEDFNISAPKSFRLDSISNLEKIDLDYPVIVKPINVFSGRGISKVYSKNNLISSIQRAVLESDSKSVVIEEFKNGTLHSHSAFIKDGRIFKDFFVDEYCTVYPYQVNCSNYPSKLGSKIRELVRKDIEKIIKTLDLTNGLLHTQFIYDDNQSDIWIIECMRRAPGDLYGKLIERATGFDYFDTYVRSFIGKEIILPYTAEYEKFYGRHTISVSEPSCYYSYINAIPGKNIETVMLKSSGMMVKQAPYDKLAIIFSEFENVDALFKVVPYMDKYITVNKL